MHASFLKWRIRKDEEAIIAFMNEICGHQFESVYLTILFTGIRRGEARGLTCDCVDLDKDTIRIDQQLQDIPEHPGEYRLIATKNNKGRTIVAAPFVMDILKKHKAQQEKIKAAVGSLLAGEQLYILQ